MFVLLSWRDEEAITLLTPNGVDGIALIRCTWCTIRGSRKCDVNVPNRFFHVQCNSQTLRFFSCYIITTQDEEGIQEIETIVWKARAFSKKDKRLLLPFEAYNLCKNSEEFSYEHDGTMRNCENIRDDENIRQIVCTIQEVANACPQSCGRCCEDDPFYKLTNLQNEIKGCTWIDTNEDHFCGEYLNSRMVRDACPVACNICKSLVPLSLDVNTSSENSATNTPTTRSSKSHCSKSSKKTCTPSAQPSKAPSVQPSVTPSVKPSLSLSPSDQPSFLPSKIPSDQPSSNPSSQPSYIPSEQPSHCNDELGWVVGGNSTYSGMTCADIASSKLSLRVVGNWCDLIENMDDTVFESKSISMACCVCGGGDHQSSAPSTSYPTLHAYPSANPSAQPSTCRNEPGWHFDKTDGGIEMGCEALEANPKKLCAQFASFEYKQKTTALACCVCGGGDHQSVVPTSLPSMEPSKKPSGIPSFFPSVIPSTTPSLR